ncbi:MAG: peptide chain release factor 2 [Bacilli bacterium]
MDLAVMKKSFSDNLKKVDDYGGYFEVDSKLDEIKSLEKLVNSPNFWDNTDEANKTIEKLNNLKNSTSSVVSLNVEIKDCIDLIGLLEEEIDEDILLYVEECYSTLEERVSKLELELLLSGEYDANNAIVEIHSGAGGTEACDWASMLYRMYIRWCEDKEYKVEVLDLLEGEEAGIKRVSFLVKGLNAYGYLRCEKGIHRLVRLSPFDSNNKRHTSFASVEVTPEIDNTVSVQINDEDLKIDVYRSSGAGGQGVNTTDSAVRVTHLPTKIVVTCQNERSQIKNKEKAISILKGKLKLLEIEAKEREMANLKGESKNIDFGSQIRSYVMHPYSMVKDHRTGCETSNVSKVLDGDLDMFIEAYLRS